MKVVVLYSQSLFAAGIESRLRAAHGLQVVRVDSSKADAMDELLRICPDVVIVDVGDHHLCCACPILETLEHHCATRVISLDLNSDEISIYRREGRQIFTSQDLLDAIVEPRGS